MTRFNFSLGGYQVQVQRQAVVSMRTLEALELAEQVLAAECVAEVEVRPPQGPGWFDSSWELVQGLDVREGLPGDARLNEWLAACLRR
ncbi:MAG: hypothetical protein H7306_24235 [Bacteriovorax sp.]|nr:hypothetical protein [Rhizobacter sp.]